MNFSKEELKTLGLRFWKFIKSFLLFLFIFSMWISGTAGAVLLISKVLNLIGVSQKICSIIFRLIITIVPFFPTLQFWNHRDESTHEEDIEGCVMDCCFLLWIIIIIVAWAI